MSNDKLVAHIRGLADRIESGLMVIIQADVGVTPMLDPLTTSIAAQPKGLLSGGSSEWSSEYSLRIEFKRGAPVS